MMTICGERVEITFELAIEEAVEDEYENVATELKFLIQERSNDERNELKTMANDMFGGTRRNIRSNKVIHQNTCGHFYNTHTYIKDNHQESMGRTGDQTKPNMRDQFCKYPVVS